MGRIDYRTERSKLGGWVILTAGGFLLGGCVAQPLAGGGRGLEAQARRSAFQSLCAQNAVECTSSWPTPVIDVEALSGQTVTTVAAGFLVERTGGSGAGVVQLIGSGSDAGTGANVISYSWSAAATDEDTCRLAAGAEFSTAADPQVELQPGFHYIRLTVMNEIIRDAVPVAGCDVVLENVASFDFLEVEIEVR